MTAVTTLPLPHGAAALDAPSDVLGAAPSGTGIYGGAATFSARSADGALYVVYCGERPGRTFGTHAFRVTPQGATSWVDLPAFTEGRVGVTIEPDGLYLSWPTANGRDLVRVRVPGYVTPGYPTSGQPAPAPAPTPQPAPPAPGGPVVDEEGRRYTTAVKRELEAKIAALGSGGGLTAQQVMDHIWAKAPDAIYARLKGNDAGLAGEVWRIVRERLGEVFAGVKK